MSQINQIIQYENGELSESETIHLFGELVKTKLAWKLQGHYGRTAAMLIEAGYIDIAGNVLYLPEEEWN
jgi:hypothetical protein